MKTRRYMKMISHLFVAMMSVSLMACGNMKEHESNAVIETVTVSDSVEASVSESVAEVAAMSESVEEVMATEPTEEVVADVESVRETVVIPETIVAPAASSGTMEKPVVTTQPTEESLATPEPIMVASLEHEHKYVVTETIEATCMEGGKEISKCDCGDIKTVTITKEGHYYELIEDIKPTCTQVGKTVYVCTICGIEEISIVRRGHHYEVTNPSAFCTGEGTLRCENCKHEKPYLGEGKGHTYAERISAQPTCVATGKKETYCTNCGHVSKTEDIPATGQHTLEYGQIGPCCVQAYCIHCDYSSYSLSSGSAEEMLGYINAARASFGSPALVLDSGMCAAAQKRAEQIVTDYSHNGNDTGYGENINMALSVADCYASWADSSGHYANMVGFGYTRMGFAWASGPDAVYFVALFD